MIDSSGAMTVPMYRNRVKVAKRFIHNEYGVELGWHSADYMQRMKDEGGGGNLVTANTNISHALRDMCQPEGNGSTGIGVPGIMTAQLSRNPMSGGQMREYVKEDLRESGAIEQDATTIIFPIREWVLNPPTPTDIQAFNGNSGTAQDGWLVEPMRFKFPKNRGGPTGKTVRVAWRKNINQYDAI